MSHQRAYLSSVSQGKLRLIIGCKTASLIQNGYSFEWKELFDKSFEGLKEEQNISLLRYSSVVAMFQV